MMNWSSLQDVVANEKKMNAVFSDFVENMNQNTQYLSGKKPTLTELETETLEKLNRDSNRIRTQSYNTTVFSLTIQQFAQKWSQNITFFLKDIFDMIYTKNISVENCYLLINTDQRMFFLGITLICISFLLFLGKLEF